MGCVIAKRVLPGYDNGGSGMENDGDGPLTEAQIMKRIIACEKTLVAPMVTAGGNNYTLKYAYVSQRGYYPNALDKENQDAFCILKSVNGFKHAHFFGIFDGHGSTGDLCSRFAADHVPQEFSNSLPKDPKAVADCADEVIKQALTHSYKSTNSKLRCSSIDDSLSGTTAISVFVRDHSVYVANTGDSRAILVSRDANSELRQTLADDPSYSRMSERPTSDKSVQRERMLAEALSIDQTPYRQDERARVRAAGAIVMTMDQVEGIEPVHDNWGTQLGEEIDESGDPPRVWHPDLDRPGCAFTRSIGDAVGESLGVVPDPELLIRELTPNDSYVILASDGVFEFITSQHVADMVGEFKDPLVAARKVVHESYKLWLRYEVRTDDITIIILKFEGLEQALLKERAPPRKGSATTPKTIRHAPANMCNQEQRPVRKFFSKAKRQVILEQSESTSSDYDLSEHKNVKDPEDVQRLREMVSHIFLFQQMDSKQLETIIDVMDEEEVEASQSVIVEGDKGDKFFIVDSGEYEVAIGDEIVTRYTNPGESFGELSLLYGKPRTASVTALTHGKLWVLERRAFKSVLMKRISGFNLLQILRNVPILKPLNKLQLQRLCSQFTEQGFADGDKIIRQGELGDKFYIVKSGSAVASTVKDGKRQEIRQISRLDYFGERALLSNEPRSADIVAKGDVRVLWLCRTTFDSIIGNLQTLLQAQIMRQESFREESNISVVNPNGNVDDALKLQSCTVRLPHGFVGTFMVTDAKFEFCAKVISKDKAFKLGLHQQVFLEKEILSSLASGQRRVPDFLPVLKQSFMSSTCVYMMYKHMVVGDFNQILGAPIGEMQARYFTACILSAVEFLHEEGIMHRRVTPDCVYLTSLGYPQLCDMSSAKKMDGQLAYTIVGDAQYLAPETIAGQGYDHCVDYWAVGILLYEMLHLANPFGDDNTDETQLYVNISNHSGKLDQINTNLSAEVKDFIHRLLCKEKSQRLGSADFKEVQEHAWFSGLQWNNLSSECEIPEVALDGPKTSRMRREEIENEFLRGSTVPPAVEKLFDGKGFN